jgi:ammonia channel protein AmtB
MWVGFAASTASQNGTSVLAAVLTTLIAAVLSILAWALGFALAELILLAIDVANDLRINRFLLKAIRYNKKT